MSEEAKPTSQARQRNELIAWLGIFIVLTGLVAGSILSLRVFSSYAYGLFARPTIDFATINTFTGMSCPTVLGRNESGTITTTLTNQSTVEKEYSISMGATTGSNSVSFIHTGTIIEDNWLIGDVGRQITGLLPAGESASIQWELYVPQGENVSDVAIIAYINNGNRIFWGNCGIVFTKIPGLKGFQLIALIWATLPVGLLLWFYGRRQFSRLSIVGIILSIILSVFILLILGGGL